MTVQFGRQARLVVGTAGNPGQIGAPASTTTTPATISDTGTADFGITNGKTTTTAATPNVAATPGQGLDLSQLRFSFKITQQTIQTPGTMECRIYNLSNATASKIQTEFTRIQLTAGYEGNLGLIFDGTINMARKGRASQVDTVLDITATDSDLAHNFAVVSTTVAAGSTPDARLAALKTALASQYVTDGYIPSLTGPTLPRGRVYFGMARDHLRTFADSVDCDWSIQQGKLQLVPKSAYAPGDVIVLTSRTGVIGLPVQTFSGIEVRCLLNPSIKPGRAIQLDNASIQQAAIGTDLSSQAQKGLLPSLSADGYYRVLVVGHAGDTRGRDWETLITCTGLNAPVPAGLVGSITNG